MKTIQKNNEIESLKVDANRDLLIHFVRHHWHMKNHWLIRKILDNRNDYTNVINHSIKGSILLNGIKTNRYVEYLL